jgi:hypothetical protein
MYHAYIGSFLPEVLATGCNESSPALTTYTGKITPDLDLSVLDVLVDARFPDCTIVLHSEAELSHEQLFLAVKERFQGLMVRTSENHAVWHEQLSKFIGTFFSFPLPFLSPFISCHSSSSSSSSFLLWFFVAQTQMPSLNGGVRGHTSGHTIPAWAKKY